MKLFKRTLLESLLLFLTLLLYIVIASYIFAVTDIALMHPWVAMCLMSLGVITIILIDCYVFSKQFERDIEKQIKTPIFICENGDPVYITDVPEENFKKITVKEFLKEIINKKEE